MNETQMFHIYRRSPILLNSRCPFNRNLCCFVCLYLSKMTDRTFDARSGGCSRRAGGGCCGCDGGRGCCGGRNSRG